MISKTLKEFKSSTGAKTKRLKTLYKLIYELGSARAEVLAKKASLSSATCARLLDELTKQQLILASELGESTGGRKPILYRINPYIGHLIGIEITSTYSTILLLNMEQQMVDRIKIKSADIHSTFETIDLFIEQIKQLLNKHNIHVADLLGIGVAIDEITDRIDITKSHVKERIEAIEAYIKQQLPTTIILGSGINFAALAEYRLHYPTRSHRFLFSACDEEIRSCMITNEHSFFSQTGSTNAFGHVTVDINGPRCSCGAFGCLHSYSSLPAIKNRIQQQLRKGKTSILTTLANEIESVDYYMIFKALELNDPLCIEILEDAAYYYGNALANAILTFQPDTVVCGGTLVPKDPFFKVVKKTIEAKLKHYPQLKVSINPAKDSYEIVSLGAGKSVLENYLK